MKSQHQRRTNQISSKVAHQEISKILNRISEQITQQILNRKLGTGVLLPLPKPKKTQGPVKNLRLITLLEAIRKILPKIFMNRTENNINGYRMSTQMDHCQNTNSRHNNLRHRYRYVKCIRHNSKRPTNQHIKKALKPGWNKNSESTSSGDHFRSQSRKCSNNCIRIQHWVASRRQHNWATLTNLF